MKPLNSLRVIDASHRLAGRLAALLLADQGADVVRVHEHTEAMPLDAVLNRNKWVLHATAGEDLQKLCAGADVIIADSDQAQSALNNQTAIRLTLPAFHPDDDMPAGGEGLVAAATGVYTDVSPAGALLGLPPIYTAIPMGNTYAAVFGATAVMAELLARGDTRAGTQLMVPLASAAMAPMGSVLFGADPQPPRYDMPPLPRVVSRKILPLIRKWAQRSERLQARLRAVGPKLYPPFANAYRCSDGEKIYVFTIDHRRLPLVLLRELGLLESAKAQGMTEADPYAPASNNNLLDPVNLSLKHKRWLGAELARVLAGKTAAEWEVKLGSAGVPCSVLRTTEEWLMASEAFTAGLLTKVSDPELGEIVQPGPHVWIDGADPTLSQPRPAKTVVAAEWVNERRSGSAKRFWRSGQPVGGAGKLPLHGCLVLDLSAMIAGPISTRTLAELGADVIKIDAPKPAHGPRMTCYYGLEASHGKRSALLDLTTPAGLAVLKRLAAQADVVVHNFTPPAMKKLGLDALMSDPDYQHLTWAGVSAFRGPKPGPWDARRGYDQVMQAATGIQVRYSDKAAPDLHGIASCVGYITGYLLTYAVMTALYCGQREARVSLAQAAQFIQAPFMLAHPNHKADEPQGRMAKGSNWHNRLYRCRDGWIYVEASDHQAKHLPGTVGVSFISDPQRLTGQLESAIRNLKEADALAMLKRATVPAISVTSLGDLKSGVNPAPHSIRVEKASHPAAREVTRVPPSWLFGKGNKLKDWGPFGKPGCNTVEVLSRAGLNEAERSQLIKSGAAATELAEAYLPE